MAKLSDVTNSATALIGNMTFTSGAVVTGATATAITTTISILYSVNGVLYTKAAMTNQALTVTHTDNGKVLLGGYVIPDPANLPKVNGVQPTTCTVYFTLGLNASGTLCVVQGSYDGQKLTGQMGAHAVGDGNIPDVPAGYTAFAVTKVVTATGASFTLGTTAFTGVATHFNVSVLPVGKL